MAKIALTDVVSGYQAATVQNANLDLIETHLNDKVLYRDNPSGEPNTMQQALDMNGFNITNVPLTPTNNAHAASKSYVDSLVTGTTDTGSAQLRIDLASDANGDGAVMIGIEDVAGSFTATTVEAALAELVTESVALAGVQTITGAKTISGNAIFSGTVALNGVNTLAGATTISGAAVISNTLSVTGVQTNTATVKWAKGADLATGDVVTNVLTVGADGNYFDFTGTDTINEITTVGVGTVIKIHFDAAATLTHNATDLYLPGGANITTAAGDEAEFVEYATGDWRCTSYTKASGYPVIISAGSIAQIVNSQTGAVATGTTVMVLDDSIPQNTEGDQYLSLAITPEDATNTLKIEVVLQLAHSASGANIGAALFQDTTADALAGTIDTKSSANNGFLTVTFTHYMTAGTVSATTFKVRAGSFAAGTMTINGHSGGRMFGGVMASSITITEYAS